MDKKWRLRQSESRQFVDEFVDASKRTRRVGVEQGERGSFVFPRHRVQFSPGKHWEVRQRLTDESDCRTFMLAVDARPEKRHDQCLDPETLAQMLCCVDCLFGVERLKDVSIAVNTLVNAYNPVPFDQRIRWHQPAIARHAAHPR